MNDQYGHAVGDKVLQASGRRLVMGVGQTDYVARIGGDEFVVALDLSGDHMEGRRPENIALSIATRLVDDIARSFTIEAAPQGRSFQVRIGASIGVSLASMHSPNPHKLIAAADQAMYQAKRTGKCSAQLATSHSTALDLVV